MPDSLAPDLLLVAARLNRWATANAEFDVPPAQARLLATIDQLGPVRIGDLARADHSSQPTVTGQVNALEASGWVERVADPADRRAAQVCLTEAGAAELARVRAARESVLVPLLDRLDESDRRALGDAVLALRRLLELT